MKTTSTFKKLSERGDIPKVGMLIQCKTIPQLIGIINFIGPTSINWTCLTNPADANWHIGETHSTDFSMWEPFIGEITLKHQ